MEEERGWGEWEDGTIDEDVEGEEAGHIYRQASTDNAGIRSE